MIRTLALSLVAALALTVPVAAAEIEVPTALGPVKVGEQPKTIVVLDVPAIDTIQALGVPVAGIPAQIFVKYLDDVAKTAKPVGTLFEPDLEALAGIGPDLIIAGGRSAAKVADLSKVAPTIDMTIDGTKLGSEALARIDTYGKLFGKEAEAAKLSQDLRDRIEAAKKATEGKGNALVVLTNGPKVSVYGPGSRFGWVHSVVGVPPAVKDITVSGHGEAVSFEFIRNANPDWLIVVDRVAAIGETGTNARQTLDNALVRETTAWKNGQVIYLDASDAYISSGGYTSMARLLGQVTDGFNAKK